MSVAELQAQHTSNRVIFLMVLFLTVGVFNVGVGIAALFIHHYHLSPSLIVSIILRSTLGMSVGTAIFCCRARLRCRRAGCRYLRALDPLLVLVQVALPCPAQQDTLLRLRPLLA